MTMPDEELEQLDEQSLFDSAVSDEETPVAETVTETPVEDQPRDEAGRFAKTEEPEKPVLEAEKPAVDDNAAQVPSWRVKEINDEKRALADRLSALEAERSTWQRQQAAEKTAVQEKAAKPDPLMDPEGYEKYIENRIEEKLLNDRREYSLASAHKTYKGEFEEAYSAAQKQIDPALKARMQQSRDPGETLIQWHRENKVHAEVGNDPNAWLEKKMAERLKDPAFLAKAVELARGVAQPQNNGRPRVDLPPSLNGAARSNAALQSGVGDVSDHDLFEQTTG
jgi:hypothetical protein